jgi:hypothetical protein
MFYESIFELIRIYDRTFDTVQSLRMVDRASNLFLPVAWKSLNSL